MNENPYQIDDDIAAEEQRLARLNEGRRLAKTVLVKYEAGQNPLLNRNEHSMICQAAVNSSQLERLAELEKQIQERDGEILGLNFRLSGKGLTGADEYQQECKRTAASHAIPPLALAVLGLGIAGEAGEVADAIKKHVGHHHKLDEDKIVKELGDTLWYISNIADFLGVRLSDVMNQNVEKLRKRYPDGFSTAASIARVDTLPTLPGSNEASRDVSDLVSDMRQGLDVEVIQLGPDQWCHEAKPVNNPSEEPDGGCRCDGGTVDHYHLDTSKEGPKQPLTQAWSGENQYSGYDSLKITSWGCAA